MAEIQDLIGVYGEVDRAVAADHELLAAVAKILPAYREPSAVGWFDEFEAWTIAQPATSVQRATSAQRPKRSSRRPFPKLDAALRGLADIEARGRMRARRLLAIAVATRAFPAMRVSGSRLAGLARGALNFGGGTVDADAAQRLLALLADDALLDADYQGAGDLDEWWEKLLNAPAAQDLLLDEPAHIGPRPCSGRLVMVKVLGQTVPVATLTSTFETSAVSFDQALRYLDPENWPGCCSFWCRMKPVEMPTPPPGVRRFSEQVSTDCANAAVAWTIEAELDFRFTQIHTDVAIAEYQLSPGHPLPNDDVLVDEGSLVVHEIGTSAEPRIRVITTKRIRFNNRAFTGGPEFSGAALSIIMCALGYAAIVEDVVFTCALLGQPEGGTIFPGHPPATASKGAGPDLGPVITAIADEAAASVKACIEESGRMAGASSQRMADGEYSADDLVRDLSGAWVRVVRDGATAADLGARGARRVAETSRGGRPRATR